MNRVYLSADIEGVTGVTHWDETEKTKPDYNEYQAQMTAEVAAACQAALQAGAPEVWVKDAHDSARNILAERLPRATRLLRGWSGHPFMMMQELDASFDAVLFIGYHAASGSGGSPLNHSMSTALTGVRLNGQVATELLFNAYTAALCGAPLVFVSGDQYTCEAATALNPAIQTVAVKTGVGNSTINIHPAEAVERIAAGVESALRGDLAACRIPLPAAFELEVGYKDPHRAYSASFYPGAKLLNPTTVGFETGDYMDVLRYVQFAM